MTDHLQRIYDATHHSLVNSTDDLYKEIGWHSTDEYNQTFVDKIKEIVPIVPRPSKTARTEVLEMWSIPSYQ